MVRRPQRHNLATGKARNQEPRMKDKEGGRLANVSGKGNIIHALVDFGFITKLFGHTLYTRRHDVHSDVAPGDIDTPSLQACGATHQTDQIQLRVQRALLGMSLRDELELQPPLGEAVGGRIHRHRLRS